MLYCLQSNAIETRDIAASVLTPQQIAQAQNMARTCQSSKFTKCDNPYGAPLPKQVARPTQQPKIVYVPEPPIRQKKSTTCRRGIYDDELVCTED